MGDGRTENGGDDASDERRLFEQQGGGETAFVASDLGVVRIELAGGRVGGFSLVNRCTARSVAADDTAVAVGTDESVLVAAGLFEADDDFAPTGFGPAVAVGIEGRRLFAAAPDGRVARLDGLDDLDHRDDLKALDRRNAPPEGDTPGSWTTLGEVTGPRRFDGSLLAAEDGVYRLDGGLQPLGTDGSSASDKTSASDNSSASDSASGSDKTSGHVDGALDVAAGDPAETAGGPFAATETGLYRLDGESGDHLDGRWGRELTQPVRAVGTDDTAVRVLDEDGLCERDLTALPTEGNAEPWQRRQLPDDWAVVDLGHGQQLYAVTEDGQLLIAADPTQTSDGQGGWHSRHVGVRGVAELAVRRRR